MIPNHSQFLEAIREMKKVSVRFYSKADSGVVDRVCAPLDYGPTGEVPNAVNQYTFWDYSITTGPRAFGLMPVQVLDLQILGERFDPAQLDTPQSWSIPRDWGNSAQRAGISSGAAAPYANLENEHSY